MAAPVRFLPVITVDFGTTPTNCDAEKPIDDAARRARVGASHNLLQYIG